MVWSKPYAASTRFVRVTHESAYILTKGRPSQAWRPLDDVQRWEYTGNVGHPTEKAISVIKPLVEKFSPPGGIVLDPFSGSGSTLVVAAFAGRRWLGIELEETYCNLARRRLAGLQRFMQPRAVPARATVTAGGPTAGDVDSSVVFSCCSNKHK
jgi:site-specific DNA-methyltransferase (adenine-specific)